MLGSHLRQSKLHCIWVSLACKHQAATLQMENPFSACPIWNYLISCCLCWVILTCSGSVRDVWLTGKAEASRRDGLLLRLLLCICVSVTHWHSTAQTLSSELDRADRRGVKPRRRHEILFTIRSPPLRVALSCAPYVFLEHALLSVKEWNEGDQRECLHRVMHTLERGNRHTPIFISQSEKASHTYCQGPSWF